MRTLRQAAEFRVEARALDTEKATEFYSLGFWATDTGRHPVKVHAGQRDEDGDAQTDTLVLTRPAKKTQVRLTLIRNEVNATPRLKFVGLNFSRQGSADPDFVSKSPLRSTRILHVPERAQLAYPGGRDWCSPTCVSMVLAYWAAVLNRPDLSIDVPGVAAGVYDRNWPGTGNWPFNTAFVGELTGMRAFVTRLRNLSEVEDLVSAGIAPILSVSFDRLNGGSSATGTGHLVVLVGFDRNGDAVLNDPWAFGKETGMVRRTVSCRDLVNAWAHSRNTVYLIHAEGWPVPRSRESHCDRGDAFFRRVLNRSRTASPNASSVHLLPLHPAAFEARSAK
jgi:hypothetical protein